MNNAKAEVLSFRSSRVLIVYNAVGYQLYDIKGKGLAFRAEHVYDEQSSVDGSILVDNHLIQYHGNTVSIHALEDLKTVRTLSFGSPIRLYKPENKTSVWYIVQNEAAKGRLLQCSSMTIEAELRFDSEITTVYRNQLK